MILLAVSISLRGVFFGCPLTKLSISQELSLLLEAVEEYHKVSFIHTAEDPVDVSLVFHPYLKQAGYARNGLQVGLRYDIQCHDIDEYLVDLVDGLLTERPLEFLEVVTIDGDLPLELFFIFYCAKLTN